MKKFFQNPRLVILSGTPGTGKTTLSKGLNDTPGLLDKLALTYLSKDVVNNAFSTGRDNEIYWKTRNSVYKILNNLAQENLQQGNSVLIEATYRGQLDDLETIYNKLIQKRGATLKFIRTVVREETLRQRIKQRGYERDKDKLEQWDLFLQNEPIKHSFQGDYLEVDMENNLEDVLPTVIDFICRN